MALYCNVRHINQYLKKNTSKTFQFSTNLTQIQFQNLISNPNLNFKFKFPAFFQVDKKVNMKVNIQIPLFSRNL